MDDCLTLPMLFHKLSLMSVYSHLKPVKKTLRKELETWAERLEDISWTAFVASPPAASFPELDQEEFNDEMMLMQKRKKSNRTHSATTPLRSAHAKQLELWKQQFSSWVTMENILDPATNWSSSDFGGYRLRTVVEELHLINADARTQQVLTRGNGTY